MKCHAYTFWLRYPHELCVLCCSGGTSPPIIIGLEFEPWVRRKSIWNVGDLCNLFFPISTREVIFFIFKKLIFANYLINQSMFSKIFSSVSNTPLISLLFNIRIFFFPKLSYPFLVYDSFMYLPLTLCVYNNNTMYISKLILN